MAPVVPLPQRGEVFLDARGDARALRVTWHHEVATVVLSLWRDDACTGSFRLPAEDVPALLAVLIEGLAHPAGAADARSNARGSGASTSAGSIAR